MSSFHSVQVRADKAEPLVELLEQDPMLSMFRHFVGPPNQGWVAVLPQRIDKGIKVAKSLSHKLHTDAFAIRTYSQDAFLYAYFRNGEKHDEYCSSPEVMKQLQEMDDEMAAIVQEWEQGGMSAEEYGSRVNEYLSNFDARKARVLSEIRRIQASLEAGYDLISAEFRGKEAADIFREAFPREDTAQYLRTRKSSGAAGGKPAAYPHLVSDPSAVARLLSGKGNASELLERFAAALKMPCALTSYQHVSEKPEGWTHVG
jgi:hypothetical protein